MFGSAILDVTIGLVLVYLLFSLICSAFCEAIELVVKSRAKELERGFRAILNDEHGVGLAKSMYDHPLIASLYDGKYDRAAGGRWWKNLPSYIPSSNFAIALLDTVTRGTRVDDSTATKTSPSISMLNLRRNIGSIKNPPVQRALLTALDTAEGDLGRTREQLEAWYDSSMDRVSGWYKRRTQLILLAIGFVIAVSANVNSLRIARYLYHDKTARDALVAEASAISRDTTIQAANAARVRATIDSLNLPIGWEVAAGTSLTGDPTGDAKKEKSGLRGAFDLLLALFGWIATALAISLGAPFWFDLLNKFMVIRSTVKPHEKSPEESSEDRQVGAGSRGKSPSAQTVTKPASTQAAVEETADFEEQAWTTGNPQEGVL
jgi:hypothetical protein